MTGKAREGGRLLVDQLLVHGAENLPLSRPCVVVSNHASYSDAVALLAAFPYGLRFAILVKRELASHWAARAIIERTGMLPVERADVRRSVQDAKLAAQRLQAGDSLVVFAEGTLRRTAGLHPFRLGGFEAAAEAGRPHPGPAPGAERPAGGGIRAEMEEFLRRAAAQKGAAAGGQRGAAGGRPQPSKTDKIEVLVDERGRVLESRAPADRKRPKAGQPPVAPRTTTARSGEGTAPRRPVRAKRESVAEHVQQHVASSARVCRRFTCSRERRVRGELR